LTIGTALLTASQLQQRNHKTKSIYQIPPPPRIIKLSDSHDVFSFEELQIAINNARTHTHERE